MNKALADTPMGRMAQLKNSFGDLQENVGKSLQPLRDAFVPVLQSLVNYFNQLLVKMQPAIAMARVFIETLFNVKAAKNADAISGSTGETSENMGDLADEAKKANKQLLGFDEINQLQEETTSVIKQNTDNTKANALEQNTLADAFGLTADQIKTAEEKAEKFRKTMQNVRDILIGMKDRVVELYNTFFKPFIDKLMGWDGKKTNTDFKQLGENLVDVGVALLVLTGAKGLASAITLIGNLVTAMKPLMSNLALLKSGAYALIAIEIIMIIKAMYDADKAKKEAIAHIEGLLKWNEKMFKEGKLTQKLYEENKAMYYGELYKLGWGGGDKTVSDNQAGKASGTNPNVVLSGTGGNNIPPDVKKFFPTSTSLSGNGRFVPQYAGGGMPDRGEMFIARENGPEMVGTIGGKTAVANNQQIVDGVAKGVARAMQENPIIAKLVLGSVEVEQMIMRGQNGAMRRTGAMA
jgi:hypothetical protein